MIIDRVLYNRIVEKKKKLDSLRPLSPALVNRLSKQIIIEWTYNSNAIEGTKLTLKETELVIEHGLTIRGKSLKDHFEAINHRDAILFIENLIRDKKAEPNELLIRQIHQCILKEIDTENAGKYREVQVQITGSKHIPPLPSLIPVKMKELIDWRNNSRNRIDIIDYAALIHFKLVDIHPFIDGNGRTARLLMNLILMQEGFPPTVILKNDRGKYYQTLGLVHEGELKPFVDFIGRNVERSLTWYLEAVVPERKKKKTDKWLLLSEIAYQTKYSQEYLSLLARRGKIEAVKKGRNWYSNLEAVRSYERTVAK